MHNPLCPDELQPAPPGPQRPSAGVLAVASLLLLITVLPARFAIDPTGIGRLLGLTHMGEVSLALARSSHPAAVLEGSARPAEQPGLKPLR